MYTTTNAMQFNMCPVNNSTRRYIFQNKSPCDSAWGGAEKEEGEDDDDDQDEYMRRWVVINRLLSM